MKQRLTSLLPLVETSCKLFLWRQQNTNRMIHSEFLPCVHSCMKSCYFSTSLFVYLFDSACKRIIVNYSTCSLKFYKFVVLFSRINLFENRTCFILFCQRKRMAFACEYEP